jgi:limonene-1,2-epoxide hydrolase
MANLPTFAVIETVSVDAMSDAESVVREAFRLIEIGDTDGALELLDPEVEWRNTGLPTVRGKRAHGMLKDMERRGIKLSVQLHHLAADGDVVLTDRTDVLTYGRWTSSFWVRGTFEVRDGKIVLWDDAFSWGDFLSSSVLGLARALTPR